ncbi:DUF2182 domain-containing protein [Halocynthiibacter namhaensis]|uniref:DUF2182 domain-containing protein n=1 Tax=Halocynthiibacter namhaensis TaxID=1290553 RepID=UPI000AECD54D|nr:DUF2182 domain-containing protein [Halocynthiibacter namhaensis]
MIATRIRSMGGMHWLALFGLIMAAWVVLYMMSVNSDPRNLSALYGATFWAALCTVSPDVAGFGKLFLMWGLMSAAMMAPTFLPALATYEELPTSDHVSLWKLLSGYLIIWAGFSILAAGAQLALFVYGLVTPTGQSLSGWLTTALLIMAGLYQFSRFKDACLSKCRMPLTFFMERWNERPWNALQMGLELGLICLGCCWALMVLAFVGGTMNILWMGIATLLMMFEKLPDIGRHITKPLGLGLIAAGFFNLGAFAL